jgi:aryl-alcohol dehydrogenase-like predicted oxidoreductase
MTEANYAKLESLRAFSQERGRPTNELAHAWLLAQPQISSVISGATRVEHVQANTNSIDWILTSEELDQVNGILRG